MTRPWDSILTVLSEITRKNSGTFICCTHCGNRHTYVKWGFYNRYLFDDSLINIQRYRCHNDLCPRKTFSILPHAFLPILRTSLCMLMHILKMYEQGNTIAGIARYTGSNWPRIQRWIARAMPIREWLQKEHHRPSSWSTFTRDFSWAFYPKQAS